MILSYLRHSMGVALVGSFSYSLMVTAKFITDAEISDIILLMTFTSMASIIIGHIRYR